MRPVRDVFSSRTGRVQSCMPISELALHRFLSVARLVACADSCVACVNPARAPIPTPSRSAHSIAYLAPILASPYAPLRIPPRLTTHSARAAARSAAYLAPIHTPPHASPARVAAQPCTPDLSAAPTFPRPPPLIHGSAPVHCTGQLSLENIMLELIEKVTTRRGAHLWLG